MRDGNSSGRAAVRVTLLSVLALALTGGAMLFPTGAFAATYTVQNVECGGDRGGGQVDAAGRFYLPCIYRGGVRRPTLNVYSATGALISQSDVDFGDAVNDQLADVAPSPDGSYVYAMRHTTKTAHRFARRADGTYAYDPTWRLGDFGYGGANYRPQGEFIASDALGNVYVSSGTWTTTPYTVVKYDAAGRFLTRFGDGEASWGGGKFYWMLTGLAVTPDGASVYTTEVGNNRVQRFDRQPSGTYTWGLTFGNGPQDDNPLTGNNEARDGMCGVPGKLAAPYDVALDAAGSVYVANTSCYFSGDGTFEVQKFTRDGAFVEAIRPRLNLASKVHAIGVDAVGNIYLAQGGVVVRPNVAPTPVPVPVPDPVPVPVPVPPAPVDLQAPVVREVVLPNPATAQTIAVTITATDDVAVTQMRLATESGAWTAWQPFAPITPFTLAPGNNLLHGVNVQVRDAAGRESNMLYRKTTLRLAAAPEPVPVPVPDPVPVPIPVPDPVPVPVPMPDPVPVPVPNPVPAPNTAPRIIAVQLPKQTATQLVTVTVTATDDVAVTQMRLANEDGRWGAWIAYAPISTHLLTPRALTKGVTVQVRDAARLESNRVFTTTLCQPCTAPAPMVAGLARFAPARFAALRGRAGAPDRGSHGQRVRLSGRRDRVRLGAGTQHVDASDDDGRVDVIDCGAGFDTVLRRAEDHTHNCERVRVVQAPPSHPG